jgi:cystathionine gamma-lyase
VLTFTLADRAVAQRFLAAATLVAEATSFGGVHASAERRGRWGTDDVPEGLIRFSTGIEDAADLVADVRAALERATAAR